jgi:hypothetical protein
MGTNERPCTLVGNMTQVMLAKQKLQEIILRGGPRENGQHQFSHGDNKQQGQVNLKRFFFNFLLNPTKEHFSQLFTTENLTRKN